MRRQGPSYEEERRAPKAAQSAFDGYAPPTSSTTYTPNQLFDVVLPHASRGCLRLVAYLIQKTLRISDADGNPMYPEAHASYRELIEKAGIGRGRIKEAIEEAVARKCIECLRFGQPHRPGEEGFSALYSLRWDERPEYITNPDEFDGFFAGEGNYTRIPNDFFDHTIPNETLAVVKVVGVVIRHTIGWQKKVGFRRQQVRMSFTDIMREAGIASRSTVNQAIKDAIERNHIERVEEGLFDPYHGVATTWGVKWTDNASLPTVEPKFEQVAPIGSKIEPGHRFQKQSSTSESVPKSNQIISSGIEPDKRSQKRTRKSPTVPESNQGKGSEFELGKGSEFEPESVPESNRQAFQNRTSIKEIFKESSKQQTNKERFVVEEGDSLALLVKELERIGVTSQKAKQLVQDEPEDVIRRQLDWLPKRVVKKTAAGLLIACIEQDLPEPAGVQTSEHLATPAGIFGRAFYAELAGVDGEPMAEPTNEDHRQGNRLIKRAGLGEHPDSSQLTDLAKRFARFTKSTDQGKKNPVRMLSFAVRLYGDEFLNVEASQTKVATKQSTAAAKKAHEERFAADYEGFVISLAERVEGDEGLLERFEDSMDRKVLSRRKLSDKAADQLLAELQDEANRSRLLVEFAKEQGALTVPGFWEWDKTRNVESFTEEL